MNGPTKSEDLPRMSIVALEGGASAMHEVAAHAPIRPGIPLHDILSAPTSS